MMRNTNKLKITQENQEIQDTGDIGDTGNTGNTVDPKFVSIVALIRQGEWKDLKQLTKKQYVEFNKFEIHLQSEKKELNKLDFQYIFKKDNKNTRDQVVKHLQSIIHKLSKIKLHFAVLHSRLNKGQEQYEKLQKEIEQGNESAIPKVFTVRNWIYYDVEGTLNIAFAALILNSSITKLAMGASMLLGSFLIHTVISYIKAADKSSELERMKKQYSEIDKKLDQYK